MTVELPFYRPPSTGCHEKYCPVIGQRIYIFYDVAYIIRFHAQTRLTDSARPLTACYPAVTKELVYNAWPLATHFPGMLRCSGYNAQLPAFTMEMTLASTIALIFRYNLPCRLLSSLTDRERSIRKITLMPL